MNDDTVDVTGLDPDVLGGGRRLRAFMVTVHRRDDYLVLADSEDAARERAETIERRLRYEADYLGPREASPRDVVRVKPPDVSSTGCHRLWPAAADA